MSIATVLNRVGWLFTVFTARHVAFAILAIKSRHSTISVPRNTAVQQLLKADTAEFGEKLVNMATYLKSTCYTFDIGRLLV